MSGAVGYLGIARKAGAVETGEKNSESCLRAGKGRLLIVAQDASDNARKRAESFARGAGIELVPVPLRKDEIAAAVGKTGCSMAVFTDAGLALSFASALAQEYGGEYTALAEKLRTEPARPHGRAAEQGRRRKNV